MDLRATVDELMKLGAITEEQARQSLDRLDTLERTKPTVGQVGRYGILGAATGAGVGALGHMIESGSALKPGGTGARNLAANALKGAITTGAIPLVRSQLDRRAEMGTLKNYMTQQNTGASNA